MRKIILKLKQIKKQFKKGISLIEMAMVLLVMAVIMGIIYGALDTGVVDKAKIMGVKNKARMLPLQIQRYEMENPPLQEGDVLDILTKENPENPSFKPYPKELVLDPWNNPYFMCMNERNQLMICSYGKDKTAGGEGENQDFMLNDENTWPEWLRNTKKTNE